jgi:hypothetical protein
MKEECIVGPQQLILSIEDHNRAPDLHQPYTMKKSDYVKLCCERDAKGRDNPAKSR